MTTLPPNLERYSPSSVLYAQSVSAYNKCLTLERSLQRAVDEAGEINPKPGKPQTPSRDLIYIRILGYLLHFVPTDQGATEVVSEIVLAKSDEALLEVGKFYYDHCIRACAFPNFHIMRCIN